MTMTEVKMIAHKTTTATFTVPSGTRSEIENSIAERLRSGPALVWRDSPDIKVDCLYQNVVWTISKHAKAKKPKTLEPKSKD
jgi:hypothetical protein